MNTFLNYEEDLAAFLEEQEQADCSISENTNEITSKESANYYIRKVKELQAELKEIEETAEIEEKKQLQRIEEWKTSTSKQYQFLIDRYVGMLRDFWMKAGDNKTMKLSQGSLCMRKMRNKTDFDEDKVLAFLREYNLTDYIENKQIVNKSVLKENMDIDGNCAFIDAAGEKLKIDGINIIEQEPKFEVK